MRGRPDRLGVAYGVRDDLACSAAGLVAFTGGAVALHQLLFGWQWLAVLVGTAALVVGVGVAGRAARLPAVAVVVAQVAAVVVLATARYAGDVAALGLFPGRAAWWSLVHTVANGADAIDHYAPPAPAVGGIELLLLLGGGVAAIALDVLVGARRLPAAAGLVVLALQGVVTCCLPAGISTLSFLLGGACWLLLLLVCGRVGDRAAGRAARAQPGRAGPSAGARDTARSPAGSGTALGGLGGLSAAGGLGGASGPGTASGVSSARGVLGVGGPSGAGGAGGALDRPRAAVGAALELDSHSGRIPRVRERPGVTGRDLEVGHAQPDLRPVADGRVRSTGGHRATAGYGATVGHGPTVRPGAHGYPAGRGGGVEDSRVPVLGRRTAMASLGLAALAPALVPRLSSGRVTALFATGDGGLGGGGSLLTVRSPLVEIRRDLIRPRDVEVLRYGTVDTTGQYLRLATLDVFDGSQWTARHGEERQRTDVEVTPAEGLTAAVARTRQTIAFTVADGLASTYLPVPYPVTSVHADGGWWFDPAGLDVISYGWQATGGFRYAVTALDLSFTPAALRRAGTPAPQVRARDLALPRLPAVVGQRLRAVVAGSRTDFDRAVAVQEWFRSEFTYDISIVDGSDNGALARFLESRRGYCQQFAATMAVMARLLGIPARVVVGFLPGTQPRLTEWVVTAHQAHAWPELYFEGSGWVRFEPTPAVQTGSAPAWTVAATAGGPGGAVPYSPGGFQGRPVVPLHQGAGAAAQAVTRSSQTGAGAGRSSAVVAGVGGLAVLVGAVPAATARLARERRWRAAGRLAQPPSDSGSSHPGPAAGPGSDGLRVAAPTTSGSAVARSTAAAVERDLAEVAVDHLGSAARRATPRQLDRALGAVLRGDAQAAAAASRLLAVVEQVRFAAPDAPLPALDPARARADSDLVRSVLAGRLPRWRRAVTVAVPASLRLRLAPRLSAADRPAAASRPPAIAVDAATAARRGASRV